MPKHVIRKPLGKDRVFARFEMQEPCRACFPAFPSLCESDAPPFRAGIFRPVEGIPLHRQDFFVIVWVRRRQKVLLCNFWPKHGIPVRGRKQELPVIENCIAQNIPVRGRKLRHLDPGRLLGLLRNYKNLRHHIPVRGRKQKLPVVDYFIPQNIPVRGHTLFQQKSPGRWSATSSGAFYAGIGQWRGCSRDRGLGGAGSGKDEEISIKNNKAGLFLTGTAPPDSG